MKIGVYVGSFNPIHKGHIKVVKFLIENNYVNKIIIIPTGNYWHKQDLIDINDHINMVKFYENENIIVDDTLNHLPNTYQVLNELKKLFPNEELNLIIGDDNLEKFHLWKNVEEILKNKVLVIPRNNINTEQYINSLKEIEQFVVTKEFPQEDVSSTMIRDLIENNNLENVLLYIDKEVLDYIIKNNLYSKSSSKRLNLIKKSLNNQKNFAS